MSDCLDPSRLASQQAVLEGQLALSMLPRVQAVSPEATDPVSYSLRFWRAPDGCIQVKVRVAARLVLRCERCLSMMDWPLESESTLAVVFSDEQAKHVAEDLEPMQVDNEGRLSLVAMVEDEILMALPLAPVHSAACGQVVWEHHEEMVATETAKEHPFAVLAALKKLN
ncbi:MAG TPA: hypothetical protein ENN01_01325 [Halothiobacillus sp.]|nr:hypothetical protein [Halothiobacillus sp.]